MKDGSEVASPAEEGERVTGRKGVLQAISTAPPTTCEGYRKILEEIVDHGPMDGEAARLIDALLVVSALVLRPRTTQPLIPWFEGVSPLPADMADELLDELTVVASELPAELAARARDVLWEARRDAGAARQAARDYAALVDVLREPRHSAYVRDRVDRAFDLARMMRNRELEAEITEAALEYVRDEGAPTTGRVWVADVLVARRADGSESLGDLLEDLANASHPTPGVPADWEWVRGAWEVVAEAHKAGGDAEKERAARLVRARSFEEHAEWLSSVGANSAFMKAHLLRSGLLALRQLGGCQDECARVEEALAAAQRDSVGELKRYEAGSVNLSKEAARAIDWVTGRPWRDALLRLCMMVPPAEVSELREVAQRQAKQTPLLFLIGRQVLDRQGRVVAEEKGDSLEPYMHQHAAMRRQAIAVGAINPARRQIACEHVATAADWIEVLRASPLLDPSRMECWVKGFDSGLRGDFLVATHLLVPQLEHALRRVLEMRGVSTTAMDDEGIQRGNAMRTILEHPELTGALGEDMVFDLLGLLVRSAGSNIRNLLAHGMLTDAQLHEPEMAYLWYACLRLMLLSGEPDEQGQPARDSEPERADEAARGHEA